MRKSLLAVACLLLAAQSWAQNRTLGVGVTTPNPNAALHVESPTGNQGLILPRLTTAQRLDAAFTGALSAADNGLMVYDTDLNTLYIWNGTMWQTTAQVAGGVRLSYPYDDTVTFATGTADLFALRYTNDENKRLLRLENLSMINGSSVLSVMNAGMGLGAYVQNTNPNNFASTIYAQSNSDNIDEQTFLAPAAIYGESIGTTALGGSFRNQNPENPNPALWAETLGTGSSVHAVTQTGFSAILGEATGGWANGVAGVSHSEDAGSYAVLGENLGGGPAGVFGINNEANESSALQARTNGLGSAAHLEATNTMSINDAVRIESYVGASALRINAHNDTNEVPALVVESQGGGGVQTYFHGMFGSAGSFEITNSQNNAAALSAVTSGGGAAVRAENYGTGDGFAGEFRNSDSGNNYPAIQAETAGTGSAIRAMQTTGPGPGIDVFMQNPSSNASGIQVSHTGLGSGVTIDHQNNGIALDIQSGAVKYSVVTITATGGAIAEVAAIYKFQVTGQNPTFTLPATVPEGTFCKIFNDSGTDVYIDEVMDNGAPATPGFSPGSLAEFIFLSGAWHVSP